jgi:hypothetical protein
MDYLRNAHHQHAFHSHYHHHQIKSSDLNQSDLEINSSSQSSNQHIKSSSEDKDLRQSNQENSHLQIDECTGQEIYNQR